MSKQHSYQQLELDLWSETVIATSTESQKSEVKKTVRYTCSVEDFKAQQELENDLMHGKQEQILAQFEAMRAEAYKYNF